MEILSYTQELTYCNAFSVMKEALIKQELEHGTKSQASALAVKQTFHLIFNREVTS